MATFGTINSLVNSAQSSQVSYIDVPNSDYTLYYPSVTATGDVVSFEADNGYDTRALQRQLPRWHPQRRSTAQCQ